ncbi:hydrogenase maturation protease [Parapedobacter koreensis]|uniref:Hydrogenase maturation protease n=1 Tax=Parapedobacter koreensis TaxID=332977 RepID=A0A1H7TLL8_9SPHI|nr:hydrogenase maturation protease [Parapedobacter koreensis]SEL85465.1 hydrogenase maturation protease [Parapedobacter koreensis]
MLTSFPHKKDLQYSQGNDMLILGLGNYLMGDEGVGVHFVNSLQPQDFPSNITILDGGTGGFLLVPYLESHAVAILVDATQDGQPAGTVSLLQPRFSDDFPVALSGHNFGLKDMVDILSLFGRMPEIYLFTISIDRMKPMDMALSPAVETAIPVVKARIQELTSQLAARPLAAHGVSTD